jgi:pimeloyl-ACP methyl ester carboxylesterase
MPEASINGITVAYDDVGEGTPLLLVHGHPFDRSMWAPQIRAFGGASARVIAPDLRGYGMTSVVPGKTTLDVFAADLAALLDHLDLAQVVIVGLSMGGQIVMEFCRAHPDRVLAAGFAATSPQAEDEAGKAAQNAMADRLLAEGMATYAKETLPKMVAPRNIDAFPGVAKHVLTMMQSAHPEGAAAALRGRAERPAYDDVLAGLRAPAMIVAGSEDAFTTRADAERMKGLMPHAELVWLEGVGHMPHLERQADFNAALARLLERAP